MTSQPTSLVKAVEMEVVGTPGQFVSDETCEQKISCCYRLLQEQLMAFNASNGRCKLVVSADSCGTHVTHDLVNAGFHLHHHLNEVCWDSDCWALQGPSSDEKTKSPDLLQYQPPKSHEFYQTPLNPSEKKSFHSIQDLKFSMEEHVAMIQNPPEWKGRFDPNKDFVFFWLNRIIALQFELGKTTQPFRCMTDHVYLTFDLAHQAYIQGFHIHSPGRNQTCICWHPKCTFEEAFPFPKEDIQLMKERREAFIQTRLKKGSVLLSDLPHSGRHFASTNILSKSISNGIVSPKKAEQFAACMARMQRTWSKQTLVDRLIQEALRPAAQNGRRSYMLSGYNRQADRDLVFELRRRGFALIDSQTRCPRSGRWEPDPSANRVRIMWAEATQSEAAELLTTTKQAQEERQTQIREMLNR